MKSSLHNLIPFLPFLLTHLRPPTLSVLRCNCQLRNSAQFSWKHQPTITIQFLCSQAHILAGWRLGTQLTQTIIFVLFIKLQHGPRRKQSLYCWEDVFTASLNSNVSYAIAACVFLAAGMCLPSSCLGMDVSLISPFRLSGVMSQYFSIVIAFQVFTASL
jgi:hypothetical protein